VVSRQWEAERTLERRDDVSSNPRHNGGWCQTIHLLMEQMLVLEMCSDALTPKYQLYTRQRFALVGYSQGTRVVRIGATKPNDAAQEKIVAAIAYGDLGAKRGTVNFPPNILAKSKGNCIPGDPVRWWRYA
jgi:hypothetical protein